MTDVFLLSTIGALGLLYGVSSINKPKVKQRSIEPSQKEPRRSIETSQKEPLPKLKSILKSNMDSKVLFTTKELKKEDIVYYSPEIIVLDNPKLLNLEYEFSGEKTIQIYWKNYSKLKTYSDFYCYGIKLKKDKLLNIIVVHLTNELYGDDRLRLTVSKEKCLKGLDVKENEDIIIMGLKSDKTSFYIGNKKFYLIGNVYSNTNFKSINSDSNGVTMINYRLDLNDYIMFDKEWVIPQKKYVDLIEQSNPTYKIKKIDHYIQIQKGSKKWIMVKVRYMLKENIKASNQVLVEENKKYSIQTNYSGTATTYNLPRI